MRIWFVSKKRFQWVVSLDKCGQSALLSNAMSALASEKGLILLGFIGGPFRARTGDPLIKSSPKPTNQAKPNQKFPKFSRRFAPTLWVGLASSAAISGTIPGQILDSKPHFGLPVAEEVQHGCESLRRSTSGMG